MTDGDAYALLCARGKDALVALPMLADQFFSNASSNTSLLGDDDLRRVNQVLDAIIRYFDASDDEVRISFVSHALLRVLAHTTRFPVDFKRSERNGFDILATTYRVTQSTIGDWCYQLGDIQLRFATALLRTQLLQCASQHLAAASEHVRTMASSLGGGAGVASVTHVAGQVPATGSASTPHDGCFVRTAIAFSLVVIQAVLKFIDMLGDALLSTPDCALYMSYARTLGASLRDSFFFEHAAQALVLALQVLGPEAIEADDPEKDSQRWSESQRVDVRQNHELICKAMSSVEHLGWCCTRTRSLATSQTCCPQTAADLLEAVSGPYVKHLVLATGLSALHAADSGPEYGLAPELLVPLEAAASCPRHLTTEPIPPDERVLNRGPLINMLKFIDSQINRFLDWQIACRTALRVARLGLASVAAELEVSKPSQSGARAAAAIAAAAAATAAPDRRCFAESPLRVRDGGQDSSGGIAGAARGDTEGKWWQQQYRILLPPSDGGILALMSLATARSVLCGATPRSSSDWLELATDRWRLSVACMVNGLHDYRDNPDLLETLRGPLTHETMPLLPEGPLPLAAPPEVAAALAGGLLPCLEQLMRATGRQSDGNEAKIMCGLLVDETSFWFGRLIMYGDPHQATSLLASVRKLLITATHLRRSGNHVVAAYLVATHALSVGPAWLAAAVAGGDGGRPTAGTRLAGALLAQTVHARLREHSRQLFLNVFYPGDSSQAYDTFFAKTAVQAVRCVQLLLHAFPDPAAWGAATAARTGGSGGGNAPSAAVVPPPPTPPDWRLQMLKDADAVALLASALRIQFCGGFPAVRGTAWGPTVAGPADLADALCRTAMAFPDELRSAALAGTPQAPAPGSHGPRARTGRRVGGRGGGTEGQAANSSGTAGSGAGGDASWRCWPPEYVRALAACLRREKEAEPPPPQLPPQQQQQHPQHQYQQGWRRRDWLGELAEALDRLVMQLELWAAGACKEQAAGPLNLAPLPAHPELREASRLLVSPVELHGLLGRCCANPDCVNLEGDSEAGLRLQTCGRCGVVAYCGRDCQRAHWAAGHKAECGRRGGGVAPVDTA